MPKPWRRSSPVGLVFACAILGALLSAFLYEFWRYPVAMTVLTAAAAAVAIGKTLTVRRRLAELARGRPGESICEFSRAFEVRNTDTWVIRAVYEELQAHLRSDYPDFPIRLTDRLVEDLHLDADDIDLDLFTDVAQRAGRSTRDTERNPLYGRVKTVQDLVAFVCAQEPTATN